MGFLLVKINGKWMRFFGTIQEARELIAKSKNGWRDKYEKPV